MIQHVAEVNKSLHAWEQSDNVSQLVVECSANVVSVRNSTLCLWSRFFFLSEDYTSSFWPGVTFMQSVVATQEPSNGLDWPSDWLRGSFTTHWHEYPLFLAISHWTLNCFYPVESTHYVWPSIKQTAAADSPETPPHPPLQLTLATTWVTPEKHPFSDLCHGHALF